MRELRCLGCKADATNEELAPLKPYFDAVVLPLRRSYAWGVPSSTAVKAIAAFASPAGIVECGAGTGYWAQLLREAGVSVRAYDIAPVHGDATNGFHALGNLGNALPFCKVGSAGAEAAAWFPDRTLFLCWPPRETDGSGTGRADVAFLASDALKQYAGETVAYVGVCRAAEDEVERYDTAGETFERALTEDFDLVERVELPNWPPLRDSLTLWRRKRRMDRAADAPPTEDDDQDAPLDAGAVERRAQARRAALSEVRWAGFDRGWAFQRLSQSRPPEEAEEREMLTRSIERAPWVLRLLGRLAARRWERG